MHKLYSIDGALVRADSLQGKEFYFSLNSQGEFSPFRDLARLVFQANEIPDKLAIEMYRDITKKDLSDEEILRILRPHERTLILDQRG